MELENGKLRIRNATPTDAGILCRWWNDGAVMAHAGFPRGLGLSEKEVVDLIEKDDDRDRRLIIEYGGMPIGEMSCRMAEEKVAEIGIKICVADMQDKGYGTACLKMLIEHLFTAMGCDKIILDTNLRNTRAQHVYEKLGFVRIRTNLDSWRNQVGELQSSVDYVLSKREYS